MPRKKKSDDEKKYDLTININENLLNKIDELVEKNGDKRSRLIERLLTEYVEQNKNKIKKNYSRIYKNKFIWNNPIYYRIM